MIYLISYAVIVFILIQYQLFKLAHEEDELKLILKSSVFWIVEFAIAIIEKAVDFYTKHFCTPYLVAYVLACIILKLRKPSRETVLGVYFQCKVYRKYGREGLGYKYERLIKRATSYWMNKK